MDSENASVNKSSIRRAAEARRSATLMRRVLIGLKTRMDDELRSHHLTAAQWRFLMELKDRPGSSGAQMARACHMTPQSAQAMMARAVKHGWIVRGKSPENHRVVTAKLTPAGERLLSYADGILARLEAEVWVGVGLVEMRAMNATLERGLGNLDGDAPAA